MPQHDAGQVSRLGRRGWGGRGMLGMGMRVGKEDKVRVAAVANGLLHAIDCCAAGPWRCWCDPGRLPSGETL